MFTLKHICINHRQHHFFGLKYGFQVFPDIILIFLNSKVFLYNISMASVFLFLMENELLNTWLALSSSFFVYTVENKTCKEYISLNKEYISLNKEYTYFLMLKLKRCLP